MTDALTTATNATSTETSDHAVATATITTAEPARIILRLCKHWGHKFNVSYDDTQGRVELTDAVLSMTVGDGQLHLRIEAPAGAGIARLADVVADHAQRMARGETYTWDWQAVSI